MYSVCDQCAWLRAMWAGEPILPQCANHPQWPGQLHDVPGVPCPNYQPKPAVPTGDNVRWIPLGDGHYAYVDAADYNWLRQWNWRMCSTGYAGRWEKGKWILMHREIMQPPKGMIVDHADRNKANNCRLNLRVCTHQENLRNSRKRSGSSSRFKGVGYSKRRGKWYARASFGSEKIWLGYFTDEAEAARAYDRKAVELFGEYARLNFPQEWPAERRAEVQAQHHQEGRKTRGGKKAASAKGRRGTAGKKLRTTRRPKTKARRAERSGRDIVAKNEKRRKNGGAPL
jgi:hypothetical protein